MREGLFIISRGIGQVMFQGNTVLAGVFFLLGILVNSRINGLYTILGALLPIPFALLLEWIMPL